tara:strand:+ start:235 stop:678 length:444 start_codon:yes stop_codon:yes gene_type:complete
MILKKKFLYIILFFIIVFQTLLYTNNSKKTSFRYFKWTVQEVTIGKLISISFFSGLLISTLLNTTTTSYKKNTIENIEENYEPQNNDKDIKTNIEMPPQRDIRDAQPTISVNYRVIKDNSDKNINRDQNYSNIQNGVDDWDNGNDDW